MSTTILFKNARIFHEGRIEKGDLLIKDGLIAAIGANLKDDTAKDVNLEGKLLVHNFIDMHTHLRDPGLTYKEDVNTGTMSALYGGYGTVIAMANTKPVMDNADTVQVLRDKVKDEGHVHVYTYAAITKGLKGEELTDMEGLMKDDMVIGFSDDGVGVQDDDMMDEAMHMAHDLDTILVCHCEDNDELKPGGCVHDGIYAKEHNLVGINNASEYNEVRRDIKMALRHDTRFHVCHISTRESVEALRTGRSESLKISGEVTPHHLVFDENDIVGEDEFYKMNPPLRSKEDHEALIEGLKDGTITAISTDHAPHATSEKRKGMTDAAFGIIGLQHAFPIIYTKLVRTGIVPLETVLAALTTGPADILRLEGDIRVGAKANICVFDLNDHYEIKEQDLKSKAINTPFLGERVYGRLMCNIVDGELTDMLDATPMSDMTVKSHQELVPDVYEMVLEGDAARALSMPGQFINLKLTSQMTPYLRRPMSVCDYDKHHIKLIYRKVGVGTAVMAALKPGDKLNVLSGLGHGFDVAKTQKKALVIGGGLGVPPMYRLTKDLLSAGLDVTVVLGFNSADDVFYAREFEALAPTYLATMDGSLGTKGTVLDAIKANNVDYDYYYACGPLPMLEALAQFDENGQLSYEARMGCGFGACMGCSQPMKDGSSKRVCLEGPVFDASEVMIRG